MRRVRLACLAALALQAIASSSACRALPSIKGATGLIQVPDANIGAGSEAFLEKGSLGTIFQTMAFGVSEFGLFNSQGKNYISGKVKVMPDVDNEMFWLPAVALGVRGMASTNEQREYYLALSKKFSYPDSTVTFGFTRHQQWKHGTQTVFWGLSMPLTQRVTFMGDWQSATGQANAGLSVGMNKNVTVFGDVVGALHKAWAAKPHDVVGACYQSRF